MAEEFLRIEKLVKSFAGNDVRSAVVEPWYRATLHYDRNRLAEAQAAIDGVPHQPDDPTWEFIRAMEAASFADPEVFRAYLGATQILFGVEELRARPGFADKVMALGGGWRDQPVFGPTRDELVKTVNA